MERWLERSKFAGGQITSFRELSVYADYWEAVDALPRGWALLDRSPWLIEYMKNHDCDRRQALVRLLSQKSKDRPFLSATVLGYALLETPKHKSGVREGFKHSYSEPLVGLVQYAPVAHFQAHADPEKSQPYEGLPLIWKREWLKSNNTKTNPDVFLITQTEKE